MRSIDQIYNDAFNDELEKHANIFKGLRLAYTGARRGLRQAVGVQAYNATKSFANPVAKGAMVGAGLNIAVGDKDQGFMERAVKGALVGGAVGGGRRLVQSKPFQAKWNETKAKVGNYIRTQSRLTPGASV